MLRRGPALTVLFQVGGSLYVLCQRVRNTTDFFQLRGVELAKFTGRDDAGRAAVPDLLAAAAPGTAAQLGEAAGQHRLERRHAG